MPLSALQPVFLADRWSSKSASDVQKNVCRSRYKHQMQMQEQQIREGADTGKESSGILPESDL